MTTTHWVTLYLAGTKGLDFGLRPEQQFKPQ